MAKNPESARNTTEKSIRVSSTIPKTSAKSQTIDKKANVLSLLPIGGWVGYALLFIVCMVLYINTMNNGFALDDGLVILENKFTKQGFAGIGKILTTDAFKGVFDNTDMLAGGRYRPLSMVTFAIEYQLYGNSNSFAQMSHGINVLLYAFCVLLLFSFLKKRIFSQQPEIAFIVAFLFAIHPIHTEAVANLKGRDELLCFIFMFLSLDSLFKAIQSEKNTAILFVQASVYYFLALLSKENAITFIGIVPVTLYFFTKIPAKRIIKTATLYFGTFIMYFILRISFTKFSLSGKSIDVLNQPYSVTSPIEGLATKIFVLGKYLSLLIFPYPLSFDYSFNQIPYVKFDNSKVWLSIGIHLVMVVIAILGWKKKNIVSYCIIFYLMSISIVSNIVIDIGAFLGERFLFQGSLALSIVAGYYLYQFINQKVDFSLNTKRITIIGVLLIVALPSGGWIIERNRHWANNETLFLHDVKVVPNSAKAQKGAGEVLIKRIDENDKNKVETLFREKVIQTAIGYYATALRIHPTFIDALLDMGACHYRLAQYDSAEYYWKKAEKLDADHPILLSHKKLLASIPNPYLTKADQAYADGHYDLVPDLITKAITHNPKDWKPYYVLGNSLGKQKKFKEAVQAFKNGIALEPNNVDLLYNLGGVAYMGGEYQIAIDALTKTLAINPNYPKAAEGLKASQEMLKR